MTLNQLAKTLNQPIGNLIRKARQVGLQVGQNSTLTTAQICHWKHKIAETAGLCFQATLVNICFQFFPTTLRVKSPWQ